MTTEPEQIFEEENIWKLLFKIAPPVMLAQLIQALYNIVDSFFVGRFSSEGLTALSVIFPIQVVITAIAVGTGVGVNTAMSRSYAHRSADEANETAGTGSVLAIMSWILFSVASMFFLKPYILASAKSPAAVSYAISYGTIVCVGSLGIFLESIWTKVHQAGGNMRLPMVAQVLGALTNIVLDPLLIFGLGSLPKLGIAGAAYATLAGQFVAAVVTLSGFRKPPCFSGLCRYAAQIYLLGYPSIFMQTMYTIYIVVLNVILASFSDQAVTVLGLYYKLQSFFFIPFTGLQTCIVPLLSYTYAQSNYTRCRRILKDSILLSLSFMLFGAACFMLIPDLLLRLFSSDSVVLAIGIHALRIIGISFVPAVFSLILPVFFQAIGSAGSSVLLSLTRQIFCLIPIFWLLSKIGLDYVWLAFPLSEIITSGLGFILYGYQIRKWQIRTAAPHYRKEGVLAMKMITAIVNRKDAAEVCQALTSAGFYFTKMATTGGFLAAGNTTLLIGTENEKVSRVMEIIRIHCSKRIETLSNQVAAGVTAYPMKVTVGGATVFVTPVEEFEKI